MESNRKRGHFNTECLAAGQFINPTQAPSLSPASHGLQDRKKYYTSNIYTVKPKESAQSPEKVSK